MTFIKSIVACFLWKYGYSGKSIHNAYYGFFIIFVETVLTR